jgi:hypothetical protein
MLVDFMGTKVADVLEALVAAFICTPEAPVLRRNTPFASEGLKSDSSLWSCKAEFM